VLPALTGQPHRTGASRDHEAVVGNLATDGLNDAVGETKPGRGEAEAGVDLKCGQVRRQRGVVAFAEQHPLSQRWAVVRRGPFRTDERDPPGELTQAELLAAPGTA
jgi:hypothetical protein